MLKFDGVILYFKGLFVFGSGEESGTGEDKEDTTTDTTTDTTMDTTLTVVHLRHLQPPIGWLLLMVEAGAASSQLANLI